MYYSFFWWSLFATTSNKNIFCYIPYLRLHQTKIYSATFQNEDGNALSLMPSWELIVEDDKREYFEIMEQNGELSITVTNVEYLQNTAVKIRCSDSSGTISAEVECKVVFGF